MSILDDIAPRLARAHRARHLELQQQEQARLGAIDDVLRLERLVAHRELQEIRAGATRNERYLAIRSRKLTQACEALARAQDRLRRLP